MREWRRRRRRQGEDKAMTLSNTWERLLRLGREPNRSVGECGWPEVVAPAHSHPRPLPPVIHTDQPTDEAKILRELGVLSVLLHLHRYISLLLLRCRRCHRNRRRRGNVRSLALTQSQSYECDHLPGIVMMVLVVVIVVVVDRQDKTETCVCVRATLTTLTMRRRRRRRGQ